MSLTRVAESRPYDTYYDTTYVGPFSGAQSDTRVLATASSSNQVTGSMRYKFFRRPVMPRLNAVPPQVLLAPTVAHDPLAPVEVEVEPPIKNVEVQTMYRDSEAQTNPYTPDYIVPEGTEPEILLLKDLTFENGLPIGRQEIEMIEHARMKKNIESNLPPFTDEASFTLRRKLMEDQELREFKLRENEIDAKREERLLALQRALQERDEAHEFMASQRIESIRQNRMEEREKALQKIRIKRIKVLRRLASQRNKTEPMLHDGKKHDIIDDYFDKGSELYAPTKRLGKEIKKDSRTYDIGGRTAPLTTMGNILSLETSIPERILKALDQPVVSPAHLEERFSKTTPAFLQDLIPTVGRVVEDRLTSAARRTLRNTKHDVEEMNLILQRKKREAALALKSSRSNTAAVATPGGSSSAMSTSMPLPPNALSSPTNGGINSSTSNAPGASSSASSRPGMMSSLLAKKPKGRPPTPDLTVDEHGRPLRSSRSVQAAWMLLQSLIRGRSIQNVMYEGKYRRRELIIELRDAEEYWAEEKKALDMAATNSVLDEQIRSEQDVQAKLKRDTEIRQTSLEAVGGGLSGNLLSHLAQEQVGYVFANNLLRSLFIYLFASRIELKLLQRCKTLLLPLWKRDVNWKLQKQAVDSEKD